MTDTITIPRALLEQAEEAQQLIAAALAKVHALCDDTEKWTMSVPVRPDHDHDVVIATALSKANQSIAALRSALEQQQEPTRKQSLQDSAIAALEAERDRQDAKEQYVAAQALETALVIVKRLFEEGSTPVQPQRDSKALKRYAGPHCPDSCGDCKYSGRCLDEAEME